MVVVFPYSIIITSWFPFNALFFSTTALSFRTKSMHGAGSPQAQKIMIEREADMEFKKKLARNIAGIDKREKVLGKIYIYAIISNMSKMEFNRVGTKLHISWLLSVLLVLFTIAIFMGGCRMSSQGGVKPGDYQHALKWQNLERTYTVHVPPGYDGKNPVPLLVVFHGGGGNASAAIRTTEFNLKADAAGFIAAYPDGARPRMDEPYSFRNNPQTWNEGSGRFDSGAKNIDDVGFVNAMLDALETKFNIDKSRIYATGFSNGSSMTYYVGIHLAHRFAAIAPVAGHLWPKELKLSRPVPMIYIIGLDDPLNPPAGGMVTALGGTDFKPSIYEEVDRWAQTIGCSLKTEVILDRDGVKAIRYPDGKNGTEVIFYTVEGLGHCWPGGKELLPESLVGKTSDKLKAVDVIWDFFVKHPMKLRIV
jgi:polyhydroxybutyrate depolymerase